MSRTTLRRLAAVLLVAFLLSLLPPARPLAAQTDDLLTMDVVPALPEPPALDAPSIPVFEPLVVPLLPGLALDVTLSDHLPVVGTTLTVTLLIANRATHPADAVVLTMPLPAGTAAADPLDPAWNGTHWQWDLGQLAAETTSMHAVAVTLVARPPGDALVVEPQVLAQGLATPVTAIGGAVVEVWEDTDAAALPGSSDGDAIPPPLEEGTEEVFRPSDQDAHAAGRPQPSPPPGRRDAHFQPGRPVILRSPPGHVQVAVPGTAFDQPLRLTYRSRTLGETEARRMGEDVPPALPHGQPGFGVFFLDAVDPRGTPVHQFKAPLDVQVTYTEAQLRALGLTPDQLTIFWFDPQVTDARADGTRQQGAWVPLPTTVDPTTRIAQTTVDHFSAFQLGNGRSPSTAFIPSLQGWQTSLFTGGAAYRYALEVPAGPGGLRPSVVLSYASNRDDGPSGARWKHQASWVGRGWSLDPGGAITRNKHSCCQKWDSFTFAAMGQSFDIVRGNHLNGAHLDTVATDSMAGDLSQWHWHIADETFWRIRANSTNTWTIWSPDGLRYEFTSPLVWGWKDPDYYETYAWLLTAVVDPSGNRISFEYRIDTVDGYGTAVHPTYHLSAIRWGYDGVTPGTGTPRYELRFVTSSRWHGHTAQVDLQWEFAPNQMYTDPYNPNHPTAGAGAPHEAYRLNNVELYSTPPNQAPQLVTAWDLTYAKAEESVTTDISRVCEPYPAICYGQRMLTLIEIQQRAPNPAVAGAMTGLPKTSLTYHMSRGTTTPTPPHPGWNRLHTADNGAGGRVAFSYEHVWSPIGTGSGHPMPPQEGNFGGEQPPPEVYYEGNPYAYRFRVKHMVASDTSGQGYSTGVRTTYSYGHPALNSRDQSAMVWYAQFTPPGHTGDSRIYLARPEKSEFRGHATVIAEVRDGTLETAPLLQRTQTWFYQGMQLPNPCQPQLLMGSSNYHYVNTADSCFQTMVNHEAWKGRAYQEDVQDGNGVTLQRVEHRLSRFELPFFTSTAPNGYRRAGITRALNIEHETIRTILDGSGSLVVRTTQAYDVTLNTNTIANTSTPAPAYGNLSRQEIFVNGVRQRVHVYAYTIVDTPSSYLTNRQRATATWDGVGNYQAFRAFFYDEQNTVYGGMGTRGLRTRDAQFAIPPTYTSGTFAGDDQTFSYDAYGNQTTMRSYPGASTAWLDAGVWWFSAPGGGTTPRVTTTTYDPVFRALPREVTNPKLHRETATYDYRLGVISSVTDANGAITSAQYDPFGRLAQLILPGHGEHAANPTVEVRYHDAVTPVRYEVRERDAPNGSTQLETRVTQQFYDGLGRLIQTKVEASTSTALQMIVTDQRFDGLGRLVAQSQPRIVGETSSSFAQYTAVPGSGMRWTTTAYDVLGRVTRVTDPLNQQTQHAYGLVNAGGWVQWHELTDARGNRQEERLDGLGRRIAVLEKLANGTVAATTTYQYDAHDLLTRVTDQMGNVTQITYNNLGRKQTMHDPDLGQWSYQYQANGLLNRQTDARGQRICFYYDELDRLVATHARTDDACPALSSNPPLLAEYRYDEGSYGIGRRTTMVSGGLTTTWGYDARGRMTRATHTTSVQGSPQTREFRWTYDTANRVETQGYPGPGVGEETIRYTYDAAWRQTSVCIHGTSQCFAGTATFTALQQPLTLTLGNGLQQRWTYGDALARLTRLQVGTSAVPGSLFDRSYSYDQVGNVTRILDQRLTIAQRFRYDHRDRLTHASALDGSSNSISIQARGTYADGWPLMRLRVNGTTVKEWTVGSTSWATYSHTLATPVSDADTVDVEFVNDYASGGANRDLFVQTITVGNQVIPATARTVSYDRGAVDGQDVVASDGKMWWNGALRLTERFSYDALGNLTTKANLAMSYGATGTGTGAGPHQARSVGGASMSYDSNGNLTSGSGRSLSWTPTNMPASITSGGVTETYAYTGDGERYRRVRGSVTTLFLEGIYEETVGGAFRRYYTLNGQVVALRERSGTVTTTSYPHGDHLGSVSLVSTSSGALASQQEYDAWGQVRLLPNQTQLPIQQTGRNYTGQERDGTGFLYYKARYYDPAIGRFLSADNVVPGNASGGMDGVAVKPLTVSFTETPFLTKLNQENQFGFWYQLSDQERQQVGSPWGPMNPQALNRYSYVLNNPLRYTDPSGHCPACPAVAGFLGSIGITVSAPVAAVIAAVGSVALLAVFLSDAGNRDWLSTQIASGASCVEEFGANLAAQITGVNVYQAKGEYVPPGLSARERQKYRDAVHRYKRTWGLRANQNIPRDILDQMAGAIRDGASADDAADMADSPPEAD